MGEAVFLAAKGLQGGMESPRGAGDVACSSFSDAKAERGVFESHAWEVLADPESFRALDKLVLNEQMVRKWEQSYGTVQFLVSRQQSEKKGKELKERKRLEMERSHNWSKIPEEVAGTPEWRFSIKQKTKFTFTTGLGLVKSLPSKLEPKTRTSPFLLSTCYATDTVLNAGNGKANRTVSAQKEESGRGSQMSREKGQKTRGRGRSSAALESTATAAGLRLTHCHVLAA